MAAPVFGALDDTSVLDVDESKMVEFTIVGYDKVPHPTTGERKAHQRTFHAIPEIKGERVIAAYARGERGQIDVQSLSKMILEMLVVDERDDFLNFLEDPNLAYAAEMFSDCLDYLFEKAAGVPKALPSGSSNGRSAKAGPTSTAGRSGRAAIERGTSR